MAAFLGDLFLQPQGLSSEVYSRTGVSSLLGKEGHLTGGAHYYFCGPLPRGVLLTRGRFFFTNEGGKKHFLKKDVEGGGTNAFLTNEREMSPPPRVKIILGAPQKGGCPPQVLLTHQMGVSQLGGETKPGSGRTTGHMHTCCFSRGL